MTTYTPPIKDIQFVLHDMLKISESDVPGYADLDPEFTQAILDEAGVPCAPVLTRGDMITHEQIAANDTLVEYDHAISGRLRQARHAAQFQGTPADALADAPALGADTEAVLAEAGYSADEIEGLKGEGIVGLGDT